MNLDSARQVYSSFLSTITERVSTALILSVIGSIVVLFTAWVASGWASRTIGRALRRAKLDETLSRFAAKMGRWGVLTIGGLCCLKIFGIESLGFAAAVASLGLAIGLAFQGTLSSFAAGVMLLVFRPYKVGDVISVAGQKGKVDEIELFTTTLDTPDNRRIIIPNSQVFGAVIENVSHHAVRRVDVPVGVSYAADIDRTEEVLSAAAHSIEDALQEPAAAVVLGDLGDSAVNWTVRVWCSSENYWDVKQALTRAVKVALDEAGIEIPFPQLDLHLRGSDQDVLVDADNLIRPRRRAA